MLIYQRVSCQEISPQVWLTYMGRDVPLRSAAWNHASSKRVSGGLWGGAHLHRRGLARGWPQMIDFLTSKKLAYVDLPTVSIYHISNRIMTFAQFCTPIYNHEYLHDISFRRYFTQSIWKFLVWPGTICWRLVNSSAAVSPHSARDWIWSTIVIMQKRLLDDYDFSKYCESDVRYLDEI